MIWLIALILGILIGIGISYYECVTFGDGFWITLLTTFLAMLIALILGLCCGAVAQPDYADTVEDTLPIIAMRDGTNVEGHMAGTIFCTSGYIDEEPVYTVLVNTPLGLQTKIYKASHSYVQFTTGEPRVETISRKAIGGWAILCGDGWLDTTIYIIYIPEDSTVVNDFVLDLE